MELRPVKFIRLSNYQGFAVQNIKPYNKTMLQQCVVESLVD